MIISLFLQQNAFNKHFQTYWKTPGTILFNYSIFDCTTCAQYNVCWTETDWDCVGYSKELSCCTYPLRIPLLHQGISACISCMISEFYCVTFVFTCLIHLCLQMYLKLSKHYHIYLYCLNLIYCFTQKSFSVTPCSIYLPYLFTGLSMNTAMHC